MLLCHLCMEFVGQNKQVAESSDKVFRWQLNRHSSVQMFEAGIPKKICLLNFRHAMRSLAWLCFQTQELPDFLARNVAAGEMDKDPRS